MSLDDNLKRLGDERQNRLAEEEKRAADLRVKIQELVPYIREVETHLLDRGEVALPLFGSVIVRNVHKRDQYLGSSGLAMRRIGIAISGGRLFFGYRVMNASAAHIEPRQLRKAGIKSAGDAIIIKRAVEERDYRVADSPDQGWAPGDLLITPEMGGESVQPREVRGFLAEGVVG